jgi:hypothetical protein
MKGIVMGISYLDNNSWNDITREERLFCSHLYHSILSLSDRKQFIAKLNSINSPIDSFENRLNLSEESHWEVGFEVCFYRDLIFAIGPDYRISRSIRTVNTNDRIQLSEKRTFDLCLFSNDELVIIEAKSFQGLSNEQNEEFMNDEQQIEKLFNYLEANGFPHNKPIVKLVVLASSRYFDSKSFTLEKGIGKKLLDNVNRNYLCGLISWKQISDFLFPCDPIFKRADIIYEKSKNDQFSGG